MKLKASAHIDDFTRKSLPPFTDWPELLSDKFTYPERLNVGKVLTDDMVAKGFHDKQALVGENYSLTYAALTQWTNQLAHAMVDDLGVKPGNRVLIYSHNSPAMVACWLAVMKIGAVAVNAMAMLREGELSKIIDKGQITFTLSDSSLINELLLCQRKSRYLKTVMAFDEKLNDGAELDILAKTKPTHFTCIDTSQDDVALLGFTSGSTGEPKATMHFHRDLLTIADAYATEILQVTSDDIFVGSPPLAFTFGLGGLAIFPLRFGATSVLLPETPPKKMLEIINTHKATVCFTAPTAYQVILEELDDKKALSSLRVAVSAGENLPETVYNDWVEKTGKPILNGIGSTEMLHIFISNAVDNTTPNGTGKPLNGYQAKIIDESGHELSPNQIGRLAVKGPVGCRYLNDGRQKDYVQDGWNLTGDTFYCDEQGVYHFVARNDDMIISSGYNISGPEVESALLSHEWVKECAVVGKSDSRRGMLVQAHVVLIDGIPSDDTTIQTLQNDVKMKIAPYKYPRSICFHQQLPKTHTGKIQRFALKNN